MDWKSALIILLLAGSQAGATLADELTQIVQQDLTALGYDTGGTDGNATTKTIIAVSRFQSEHGLEVTGEITPQLAGVIKAAMSKQGGSSATPPAPAASTTQISPQQAQADLKARQQACLQQKVAAAEERARMKSGLGKLLSAVSRTASRFGAGDVATGISTTTSDASSINATITDLEGAAKDLGISQSDIDACNNP
ncbi:MAG: peptidoglycan-binding protein [Halieaceae bacterium]|jgi:peptidoglycan hydrolase-like protein with peptidoglycan-binding domain|nr:peptidoglycan-binding protein [Halieaceae bacterium]